MEERKLNFNAPLLSVRRYYTTAVASSDGENGKKIENTMPNRRYTIPFYKTDLNLEQVMDPVAVPFVWEQIPGRPKDGGPETQHSEEASVTPRLPLQRAWDIVKYPLEKEFKDWPRIESCNLYGNVARLDCSKEGNEEKATSDIENDNDVYSDALDTLSSTDSFSINCSVSGLSGSDGQVEKWSGTFSTDPQTRDFMMSRFLPAAKAMALETPQYASRKRHVTIEQQPRQAVKVVSEERGPLINESVVIPHYGEDVEEEESEDEVDECDNSGNISGKACGLFPRLCLNKSLCLLNPVPGLKVRTHSSISSSSDVKNSSGAAYTEYQKQIIKKHNWDAVYKHQSGGGVRSPRLLGIENKITSGYNRSACLSDQQMSNRSSPYRRGISPYRNERPQSPFRGGAFLGVPKEAENVRANKLNLYNKGSSKSQEFLPHQSFSKGCSLSPAVEKTLYVDTVNFARRSCSNLSSSDASMESRGIERTASLESSSLDAKCLSTVNGENISQTKICGSIEASQSSFSEILRSGGQADTVQCFRLDGELIQECKSLVCVNVTTDENLNLSCEQKLEVVDPGSIDSGSEQSPLPPPLPKKPSESWLWRTLPSISLGNSFSHSNLGIRFNPKRKDAKTTLTNTKWETIVKTSYAHHDHMRYSEELPAHFSQQSKT